MKKVFDYWLASIIMHKAFAGDLSAVAMVYSTSATLFLWSVVATAYPLAG